MTEKEKKILEMQCASTRRCLERAPELDLAWLNRPVPKEAQVIKEDGSVDINLRALYDKDGRVLPEVQIAETAREHQAERFSQKRSEYLHANKHRINWEKLGHMVDDPKRELDPHKKERATDAFMKVSVVQRIKDKFKEIMFGVKKEPSYAEHVAQEMARLRNEK